VSLEGGEEKEKKEVVVGTREIKNTQLREVGVGSSGRSHAEAGCDAPSACHPAFVYAAEHSGFSAQPWRKDNRATLSREEMETRQKTWNALVDQYIAVNQSTLDVTEACEVERAAKIFWTGGPLYNRCGHQSCGKMERQPSTFMLCSKCRQTRFCSSACFAASYIRTTTLFAARIQQNHAWRVKRCESFLVLTLHPTDRQCGMLEGVFYDTCHEITGFLR